MKAKKPLVTDKLTTQIQFRCSPREKRAFIALGDKRNMSYGDMCFGAPGIEIRKIQTKGK